MNNSTSILLEHKNAIVKQTGAFQIIAYCQNQAAFDRMTGSFSLWFSSCNISLDSVKMTITVDAPNDKEMQNVLAQIALAATILQVDTVARDRGEKPVISYEELKNLRDRLNE